MPEELQQYLSVLTPQQVDEALRKIAEEDIGGLVTQTQLTKVLKDYVTQTGLTQALNSHCPYAVGDVYITSKAGNPSTRWPGTSWTQIKDCFLLAAGDSYKAGSTGGSKTHSHKLSSAAYAKIGFTWLNNYNTLVQGETVEGDYYSGSQMPGLPSYSSLESSNVCTPLGGQTDAQTLMPPYKAYYMWERTA